MPGFASCHPGGEFRAKVRELRILTFARICAPPQIRAKVKDLSPLTFARAWRLNANPGNGEGPQIADLCPDLAGNLRLLGPPTSAPVFLRPDAPGPGTRREPASQTWAKVRDLRSLTFARFCLFSIPGANSGQRSRSSDS